MSDCVFCRIVRGEEPANIIQRWPNALAIVPLNPVTDGHVLIVPKKHVADAVSDPAIAATAMRRAAMFAEAPCNIITSAGTEATQTVFHLHLHVVPRRDADGLKLPWTGQKFKPSGYVNIGQWCRPVVDACTSCGGPVPHPVRPFTEPARVSEVPHE